MKITKPSFYFILKERLQKRNFLYEFYFKNKKTIDIGCGDGDFLMLNKDFMHGVDLNADVINRLISKGLNAKIASADKIPYGDNEFEMAHCHNVIEHVTPKVAYGMLIEASRVLKKGGMLVLSSEIVTKKFWNTFGHTRPYPPAAIKKLLRLNSREEFEPLTDLEWVNVFYLGDYYNNKILYLLSAILGYFTPICRREYFLVLRKK